MFLRGREHESTIGQRFHAARDGFTVRRVDGVVEVLIRSSADRVVDLFLALTEELPPAVSIAIDDVRTASRWTGTALALPDVSNALARLKLTLTTFAGAEICIYSPDEQLTLTPSLELYVHSLSERWAFLLHGHGLMQRESIPRRSWRLPRGGFPPSSEAAEALRHAADRLGLIPTPSETPEGANASGPPS
ncbi:MAG: hypothetical protein ABI877_09000 [Gemmatimonadaceae bacterium]